eukprot:scaffold60723_cov38-Cyclotella_meneghiniana.AAC.3
MLRLSSIVADVDVPPVSWADCRLMIDEAGHHLQKNQSAEVRDGEMPSSFTAVSRLSMLRNSHARATLPTLEISYYDDLLCGDIVNSSKHPTTGASLSPLTAK